MITYKAHILACIIQLRSVAHWVSTVRSLHLVNVYNVLWLVRICTICPWIFVRICIMYYRLYTSVYSWERAHKLSGNFRWWWIEHTDLMIGGEVWLSILESPYNTNSLLLLLRGSHGLSAKREQKTKSSRPLDYYILYRWRIADVCETHFCFVSFICCMKITKGQFGKHNFLAFFHL